MADVLDLARPAGDGDVVGGVPARLVASPASTEEAAALLREAADRDLAVVVRGGGTKLDWGNPPERVDLIVDTRRLAGVVEHAAGDLIAVVRAGTPMGDLKLAGQQLAIDSPGDATVGGTVAVNTSGPRRMLYGTARDLLIGVTVVRPDGTVTRAGGKVVKNVAGYDLGKLYTGSYGTLGLITECVFRLHPLPAATSVVRTRVADSAAAAGLVTAVLGAQVVPSALEIDAAPEGGVEVAVLVEGSPTGVRDRAATVGRLFGDAAEGCPDWWGRLPWEPGGVGVKVTAALSRVPDVVAVAQDLGVPIRGSAGTGVLYAGIPTAGAASSREAEQSATTASSLEAEQSVAYVVERLRAAAIRAGGHAVVLTAPPDIRAGLDMWGPVPGLGLMRRVKEQFDPGRRFAPGRFVGGI
jgi:glycolate oxidase FAD binding subunit